MSRENVETVRRVLDAFAARDVEALIAEHRPDVEIVALRSAIEGPYLGHEGLRRMGAELIEQAPDFVMRFDEVRDCGDRVLVLGRQRGTVRGVPFDGVFATVFEIKAGKVSRMEAFPTAEAALEAVGLREGASSEDNVALIRHVYAEFDRRGELPWDLVSDEAVFDASDVMPDFAQPMRGKATVKPSFAAYVGTFDDFHIELEAVLAFDDRHVVTTALDGGRMQGSPTEIRNRFHHAWTVADGLIVRWSSHLTPEQALQAVGLSE